MYQGYYTGFSYFSSGTWQKDEFSTTQYDSPPYITPCDISANDPPMVNGYDPRCRPWYIWQSLPEN